MAPFLAHILALLHPLTYPFFPLETPIEFPIHVASTILILIHALNAIMAHLTGGIPLALPTYSFPLAIIFRIMATARMQIRAEHGINAHQICKAKAEPLIGGLWLWWASWVIHLFGVNIYSFEGLLPMIIGMILSIMILGVLLDELHLDEDLIFQRPFTSLVEVLATRRVWWWFWLGYERNGEPEVVFAPVDEVNRDTKNGKQHEQEWEEVHGDEKQPKAKKKNNASHVLQHTQSTFWMFIVFGTWWMVLGILLGFNWEALTALEAQTLHEVHIPACTPTPSTPEPGVLEEATFEVTSEIISVPLGTHGHVEFAVKCGCTSVDVHYGVQSDDAV